MLLPSYFAMLPRALAELEARYRDAARNPSRLLEKPKPARRLQARGLHASHRTPGVFMFHGRVALVPVFGVLFQRVGPWEAALGGISMEELGNITAALSADPQISAIVLVFDSPGGDVFGTPELAGRIRAAREKKPIIAIADSLAASAAYWLASQAGEVVASPGSQVGSIGVIAGHVDISEMEKKLGVKTTLITSSQFKAELYPENALSDEARGDLQEKVNYYGKMFVDDVAKGRGVSTSRVESAYGQGRMLVASEAQRRGMIDKVETLQALVSRLAGTSSSNTFSASTRTPTFTTGAARAVAKKKACAKAQAIAIEVAMVRPPELQTIVGYASVFDCTYIAPPDGHFELIRSVAFARFCAEVQSGERNVVACIDHDRTRQVASTIDGTLTLREDPHGLLIVAKVDETTQAGHALLRGLYHGQLAGMSIHNDPAIDEEHFLERRVVDGKLQSVKIIRSARCNEVSFVLRGANKATACVIAGEHRRFEPAPWNGYQRGTQANSLARLVGIAERIVGG